MSRNEIKFHKEDKKWGEFSNYFPTKIKVKIPAKLTSDGKIVSEAGFLTSELEFSSSEALFHALKFTQEGNVKLDIIKHIQTLSPSGSRSFAKTQDNLTYDTKNFWFNGYRDKAGGYCVRAMRYVVREKFRQNAKIKGILLGTGNDKLIENTQSARYNDDLWGNDPQPDGTPGLNLLGKILEETRTELQTSGLTPPTPPSTPPSTPPPSRVPNVGQLNNTEIHVFEAKIETELRNKGIVTSDLNLQYQKWLDYIGTKEWKVGELDNYESNLKKEIERVANKKKQPNTPPAPTPPPKANQKYRDKWVQDLEKEFQELDFGDQHDVIVKELSTVKDKIKDIKFDTEEKVENLGRECLNILKKFDKKKLASNPTKLTPEEKESLLNKLNNLNQKTSEDLGKDEEKPVEISVIKKYFQANNNVNSITLEDNGELTIEFQDKTTQTTLANNEQLQQVKKYLQQNNEKSLSREKLSISQNSNHHPTKPNYLPRILAVGGLAISVIFLALITFRQRRIRKRK